MGFENTRRWPTFILFSMCLLLTVSLFNSWAQVSQLKEINYDWNIQMEECASKQTKCMQETLEVIEDKNSYVNKFNQARQENEALSQSVKDLKRTLTQRETQNNKTQIDLDICEAELQSLKSLQITKSATLDTLRLEKDTLANDLEQREIHIKQLESELANLKNNLNKSTLKVTPEPPRQSLSKVIGSPLNDNVDNNGQEVIEEPVNDDNPIPLEDNN